MITADKGVTEEDKLLGGSLSTVKCRACANKALYVWDSPRMDPLISQALLCMCLGFTKVLG